MNFAFRVKNLPTSREAKPQKSSPWDFWCPRQAFDEAKGIVSWALEWWDFQQFQR